MIAFHHVHPNGVTACGKPRGVNALDFGGEITCKRCCKSPPDTYSQYAYVYRDGKIFIEDKATAYCNQIPSAACEHVRESPRYGGGKFFQCSRCKASWTEEDDGQAAQAL